MRFLKFIVPILMIFQIAVFAQGFKKTSVKSFASENCKTIGKNPLVTVCIESATEDAKVSRRLGKAFRRAVKDLMTNFDPELAARVVLQNPGACDEEFDQAACDADACCIDSETNITCSGPGDWSVDCCGYEYDEGGY